MQKNTPKKRKQIRLKEYDYSTSGYYFITICTQNRKEILSKIINSNKENVGVGPVSTRNEQNICKQHVGVAALGDPQIELTRIGLIVEEYLQNYNKKFKNIFIHEYIIMPNHIHFIIELLERVAEGGDPYNS